jgi:hypothetical protein
LRSFRPAGLVLFALLAGLVLVSSASAERLDLLEYFLPDKTQPGTTVRNVQINANEVFYTFPATIKGRQGFVIIKNWDGTNYEEFTYDDRYIYHWRDTTWASGPNQDFTCTGPPGHPHLGNEAFFTLLDGTFGSLRNKGSMCEEWERHKDLEGAKWVPRYMSVGDEECLGRTVIGFSERDDCLCCTNDVVGPGITCMKLVAHYEYWRGDHPEAQGYNDVIRITAMSGPGKGESWYYAKGYGWVGYERRHFSVDPISGPISDWNYARVSEFSPIGWSQVCPHGEAAEPPPQSPPRREDRILDAIIGAPDVDGLRPWEGEGVTAAWVNVDGNLGIISRDRYWVLRLSDRAWISRGSFDSLPGSHIWMRAPHDHRVDYQRPWRGAGLTAGWVIPEGYLGAVSRDKYWVLNQGSWQWIAWGKFSDLPSSHVWKRAPQVDGLYPWEGAGITAGWFEDRSGYVVAVSRDRYWTQDLSTRSWLWWGRFDDLPDTHPWKRAPKVEGFYPWEGEGITAAFVAEDKLYVFSKDRYWVRRLSDVVWIASGSLQEEESTPAPPLPPGRTSRLHGTILDCRGNREAGMYVSLWRHDGRQFVITYTDSRGIYEFHDLDPNQKYNIAVNVVFDPQNADCGPWRKVDPNRNAAVRNNVELLDGGDGWHGEDFWLCSECPE